jgi:hypothetical protein
LRFQVFFSVLAQVLCRPYLGKTSASTSPSGTEKIGSAARWAFSLRPDILFADDVVSVEAVAMTGVQQEY